MNINFQPKQINKETIDALKKEVDNLPKKVGQLPKKMPPMAGKVVTPDIFRKPGRNLPPISAGLVRPPKKVLRKEFLKNFSKGMLITSGIIAATLGTIIGIDAISKKLKAGKEAKEAAIKAQEVKTPEVKNTQKTENDAIIEE